MSLDLIINIFILLPLLGFLVSLAIPAKREILLSRIAFLTAGLNLFTFLIFLVFWAKEGFAELNVKDIYLYKSPGSDFLLDFYFDKVTAIYMAVGALLTFLITIYSRYYLHREPGYKRFSIPSCSFIWGIISPSFPETSRRYLSAGSLLVFHPFCWWRFTGKGTCRCAMQSRCFRYIALAIWVFCWQCGQAIICGMKTLPS